ncbi:MAG: ankyrin repeat domain-containing protein [Sedimentisphaerales bacterium]|nr:ankyrin repeat domain-containing protein [Sedimentisphaerales bacterium]
MRPYIIIKEFGCIKRISANNDLICYDDMTLLHVATSTNRVDMAEILIKYGADVNARAEYNITPLYIAAYSNNVEMVKLLLKYNADPTIKNKHGRGPKEVTSSDEICKLLSDSNHGTVTPAQAGVQEPQ